MKVVYKYFLALMVGCFSLQLNAQETSPIQVFSPKQTNSGNQNWMISQAKDKTLFFANNQGLVSYNATKWKLHPAKDNSIIRSVRVIDNRVYTSSYMDFGYWEKNTKGELKYTSLSKKLNVELLEDEQFWNIIHLEDAVLFQSLNRIIIVHLNTLKVDYIAFQNTLFKSFKIDNEVYFQVLNEGLYTLKNKQAVLLSSTAVFKNSNLANLIKIEDEFIIITQEKGFYKMSENFVVTPWAAPNKVLEDRYVIYSAIVLKNEQYAIGTVGKGLLILSKGGHLIEEINQQKGLSNNTVLSLFEDQSNNLWLGLDNGINLINRASPIKEYVDVNGQLGSVYTSAIQGNLLYLGTNQGLFVKNRNDKSSFELIKNTQGQVWNLSKIDGNLFCGHDRGGFLIQGRNAKLISSAKGIWMFRQHPKQPDLVFLGSYTGIYILERMKNIWKQRNKVKGFDISSRFFAFVSANEVLVNHEYKGIYHIKISENFKTVEAINIDKSSCKSCNSSLVKFDQQLFYKAKSEVFKFNKELDQFEPTTFLSEGNRSTEFLEGKLIDDGKGQLWVLSKNTIYTLKKDIFNNQIVSKSFSLSEGDRKNVSGFENISPIEKNTYLIGTSRGYLTVDFNRLVKSAAVPSITSIQANNKLASKAIDLNKEITLSNDFSNLTFQFTSFDYNRYGKTVYQYLLEGEDSNWSKWSENSTAAYANLRPGKYQFKVRSKRENIISAPLYSMPIVIAPPWYLNQISISIYAILILLLLFSYNAYYKSKLKRQRIALKEENNRILEIQELETQKEIIKLRNEQLQKDVESKSRELAVATMGTLKRNEFLNSIKEDLSQIKEDHLAKKIIKNINAKLKNNDDWDYFKKAFDNTDQGLFRKLKVAHPTLTKNDLKLCAYLRLNLSSKEIAPLLNISVHSVEIKRYRLRKKMGLNRSQGIVEYIMTF